MDRADLAALLSGYADHEFVERELLNRRPWIFPDDAIFGAWRSSVADVLKIAPGDVSIVGSAATGYSLSPLKPGRPFRPVSPRSAVASDIDIAFIDPTLFSEAWDIIVRLDRALQLGGTDERRGKIRLDIYYGLIAHQTIPLNTSPARRFRTAMTFAGRLPPLRGYRIRARVYRRSEDLRSYHLSSLRLLRRELIGHQETNYGR